MGTEKRARQKANRQLKFEQQAKQEQRKKLTKRAVIGGGAAIALLALILGLAFAFGGGDDDNEPTSAGTFTYGSGECPPEEGVTEPVKTFTDAPKECIDPSKNYTARIITDHGDVVIALDAEKAPGTVNNFVTLARYGFYDDTQIFRAAQSIDIVQGGAMSKTDTFGYTIPDEGSGFTYPAGKIAMANTGAPNSGGSQWFLTLGDKSSALDAQGTYTVFGEITEGLDIAKQMLALATSPTDDTMTETVTIERIEITES